MTAALATLRMEHDQDPREALMAQVGDVSHIEVMHNQILVAIYTRPERTKGGIYLADNTRKEDEYQGKVGLVLKKGLLAFRDDERNQFHGQDVEVGDWIGFRAAEGWQLGVNGPKGKVPCRMLEDVHVKLRLQSPDDVY